MAQRLVSAVLLCRLGPGCAGGDAMDTGNDANTGRPVTPTDPVHRLDTPDHTARHVPAIATEPGQTTRQRLRQRTGLAR